MRCLHGDRGLVAGEVRAHTGQRAGRHPVGQRRLGQCGQQLGGGRADIAAAVGEGLLQEGFVQRGQAGAQRVEEHQPVLGPLGAPRGREQRECFGGIMRPDRREQRDPLGEQTLLPQPGDRFRLRRAGQRRAARGAAQRELPLGVQPGQPHSARPGEGQGRRPQVRTGPGRVEQGRQQRGRGPEALPVGGGQPLRDQLREIGSRTAPAARAARRRPVRQQLGEPAPRGRGQRRPRVDGRRLGPGGRGGGQETRPAPHGVERRRVQQPGGPAVRPGRTAVGAEKRRGDELFPRGGCGRGGCDGAGHGSPFESNVR